MTTQVGRTQKLVLHLLASGNKTVARISYDRPDLTESAARGAVARLADRGLVEAVRVGSSANVYKLTDAGRDIEHAMREVGRV